jgi:hypothetical protein
MYRNWSARIPAGPSLGRYISGTCRIGWLGADILSATASGAFGAGIFNNDQIDPLKRYSARLASSTFPAGAFTLRERGDGEFTANGFATFVLFENGAQYGNSSFSGVIGGQTPTSAIPAVGSSQTGMLIGSATITPFIRATRARVASGLSSVSAIGAALGVAVTPRPRVSLDRWLPFVMPYVTGCPEDAAIHNIRQSAIEFLDKTGVWQETLPAKLTISGDSLYTLDIPAASAPVKILEYKLDDVYGKVSDGSAVASAVASAKLVDRETVELTPTPQKTGQQMVFVVTLKLTQAATDVTNEVFEHYAQDIADGAVARILKIAGQSWTNLPESKIREAAFNAAVDKAQWLRQKGFGRTTQRVKAVWF